MSADFLTHSNQWNYEMRKNYPKLRNQYHNSTTTNNIREKYNGPDHYTIPLNLTNGPVGT
mgnify:CR=1 FL=1